MVAFAAALSGAYTASLSLMMLSSTQPTVAGSSAEPYPDVMMWLANNCREGAYPEHCTKLHMTNCGKFDLHVEWELKSQPAPVTPPTPTGKAAAKPRSAAKDAAAPAAAPIFLFEPKVHLYMLASIESHCKHVCMHIKIYILHVMITCWVHT